MVQLPYTKINNRQGTYYILFLIYSWAGISLAVILGIAIPAAIIAAVLIAIGVLYYLKKRRDALKAR